MSAFDDAFDELVGLEGKYSNDEADPGNWTGGTVGVGTLKGTKFGISAAAYPTLNIQSLGIDQAKALYLRDFWEALKCDAFHSPEFAKVLFKQAVNMGKSGAVKRLQEALKITPDGEIGQVTIGNVDAHQPIEIIQMFLTQCAYWYTQTQSFTKYGKGWLSRVIITATQSNAPPLLRMKAE